MIVEVEWIDSATYQGWQTKSAKEQTVSQCTTVGFVMRRNKNEISIAQGKSNNKNYLNVTTIPMSCIKKITRLK